MKLSVHMSRACANMFMLAFALLAFTSTATSNASTNAETPAKMAALKVALLQMFDTSADGIENEEESRLEQPVQQPSSGDQGAQVVGNRMSTPSSADMETAITDLITGGMSFEGTPFGGSVTKIMDTIQKEMMPEVLDAHSADQKELDKLAAQLRQCGLAKTVQFRAVIRETSKYHKFSKLHKACRADEAVKYTSLVACRRTEQQKKKIKQIKCAYYGATSRKTTDTTNNRKIVTKSGAEGAETYVRRITSTFCGKPGGKGVGGNGVGGFQDNFLRAKQACLIAVKNYNDQVKLCKRQDGEWRRKKARCDALQRMMDGPACKRATLTKDICETYAECYRSKRSAYRTAKDTVVQEERDRKAEWRGLKRMSCIIGAFKDGKVTNAEIDACKKATYTVNHLTIKYPVIPQFQVCQVPKDYPATPLYKKLQFAPLPAVAKGKTPVECTGVITISTKPRVGSPTSCKCYRVTLTGPYSAGAMVKCLNCHTARRSVDKNSCPKGTKLFSPASRTDWATFIKSTGPVRAPHFIVDVTRPQNGCGGCTRHPMNSHNAAQKTWKTSDSSPWWLRSTRYNEPNGDYRANCYLDLWHTPRNPDRITWNDGNCNYHSKSYYCDRQKISKKCRAGSPKSCACSQVQLSGKYSAKILMKCAQGLKVYKSSQKNSCPKGMKIFSPASREDWKTFIRSAKPLRAPHWIIDVTRPQNGCGGCTRYPMNSKVGQQATWRTSDKSPWWLRSTRYNEPNGDYHANCFLDLWHSPPNENAVTWNDGRCSYHANSYYCQPIKKKPAPPAPPPPPAPKGLVFQNGDFEKQKLSRSHKYMKLADWKGTTGVVLAKNGNAPWGKLSSGQGFNYAVIQSRDSYISQDVGGLKRGHKYIVKWLAAARPGGTNQTFRLFVDHASLNGMPNTFKPPADKFIQYEMPFTALHNSAKIRIVNDSPKGDRSVFIDKVEIWHRKPLATMRNGGFERQTLKKQYNYQDLTSWAGSPHGKVLARNGNRPWGGLSSNFGKNYAVIQTRGNFISQKVTGMTNGKTCIVGFWAAQRPGSGTDEALQVFVDGATLKTKSNTFKPPAKFVYNELAFTPAKDEATIRIVNDSPPGDRSVFIDNVNVWC